MRHQNLEQEGHHFATSIEASKRGALLQVGNQTNQARILLNEKELDYLISDLKGLQASLAALKTATGGQQ